LQAERQILALMETPVVGRAFLLVTLPGDVIARRECSPGTGDDNELHIVVCFG
jgi:hypothetical protein